MKDLEFKSFMVVIQPLSTRLIKPNFCFDLSHRRSTAVSLETRNPLNLLVVCVFVFYFSYFPSDPPYVTDDLRSKGAFKDSLQTLRSELEQLQKDLSKSVPFFSSRYKVTLFYIEYCKDETIFRRVTTTREKSINFL